MYEFEMPEELQDALNRKFVEMVSMMADHYGCEVKDFDASLSIIRRGIGYGFSARTGDR